MRRDRRLEILFSAGGTNALLLGVIVLDRSAKAWAQAWLAPRGGLPVLPFFHLTYVENTGAAFGLGRGRNAILSLVSVALVAILSVWRRRLKKTERWTRLGLSLVIAGAVGNLYDRFAYGYVVDFLDFRVWPVFNVADSAITVGACLLALAVWTGKEGKASR